MVRSVNDRVMQYYSAAKFMAHKIKFGRTMLANDSQLGEKAW